jgi:hypothetical protein
MIKLWYVIIYKLKTKLNSVALVRPSDHRLSVKEASTSAERGYRVVSASDLHDRILRFLDRKI